MNRVMVADERTGCIIPERELAIKWQILVVILVAPEVFVSKRSYVRMKFIFKMFA